MTDDTIGRDELRQLLFDRIPAPDDAAREAMFDRTLGSDGPTNDDLLPPAGLFDDRAESDPDPDPEHDVVDGPEPHDTQDWAPDDGRSWEIESDHGDHHVDPGHHGDQADTGHPEGTHDAFHDGTPGSW